MGLRTNATTFEAALDADKTGFPKSLLPTLPDETLSQRPSAEVLTRDRARFEVRFDAQTLIARRAASCLLEPEPGDVVAIFNSRHGVFITDVLIRAEDGAGEATISAAGADGARRDLKISTGNLLLDAEGKVEASGKSLGLRFGSILMSSNQLVLVGKKLMTSMQDIVTNATKQLASFDTSSTRARNRMDRIVEIDQLRAGAVQTNADTVSLTQAGTSLIVAQEDVRLDGKRISMG